MLRLFVLMVVLLLQPKKLLGRRKRYCCKRSSTDVVEYVTYVIIDLFQILLYSNC
jgi:hypothetical protein